ncbi:hypothetical protein PCANC_20888 [Puccinia coronata f. sp. avenae]|uniref:Uncharacterized protein n=1 Tax=Puccinia coronata f. sp. avenae TaxID=200324 RepID=A0A2N5SM80_9BASI|nr:hypothetical protein PCANC_20888 [Puccinia coronata f. sp. avenae]
MSSPTSNEHQDAIPRPPPEVFCSGEPKHSDQESVSADFVKIRPNGTIKVELDMTTSDMTELKQAVFQAVVASREDIRFGPILYQLETNGALHWKACTFLFERLIRTYNLPAEFNDFSDIFNTSKTQLSATVGLTMDYPKKEILSAKKNSSDVG